MSEHLKESLKTRLFRIGMNFVPVLRRTGGRVTFLSDDYRCVKMKLPLNLGTRNYVGTIYGGSMFSACDGIYMVMLINILGKGFIVWDKEGTIRFRKPGRNTLHMTFLITDEDLQDIRDTLQTQPKMGKVFTVHLIDEEGDVCAEVDKLIYIRKK